MDRALGIVRAALARRTRSAGARLFVLVVPVVLAFSILLPARGVGAAAVALEGALVVLGVGAALVAAASAGSLPDDRTSGVLAWLAATACPRPMLRAAPAIAGALATLAATVLGAGVLAALLVLARLEVPTRATTPLLVEEIVSGAPRARSTVLVGLAGSVGERVPVELEIRPHFRSVEAAGVATVDAVATTSAGEGSSDPTRVELASLPTRGRVDVDLPAGRRVTLAATSEDVELSVVAARRVDGPASFVANVLRAGLLLGLALASLAPVAALLSRFLSASTAVTAALVLGAVGIVHGPLLALAADARGVAGADAAGAILRATTWIAPDLSVVSAVAAAVEGHVIGAREFAGLLAPAAAGLVALVLLTLLPSRRVDA